jgi:nicotinamidase-related amidase
VTVRHAPRTARAAFFTLAVALAGAADAQTIIEEWKDIKAPEAPALKPVTVDPKDTALLMLDYVKPLCGARPRCVAAVPKKQPLLAKARESGMLVVYSLAAGQTAADVMPELAPRAGEPVVSSGPDKFLNTDLEKILRERGIKAVIVGGTAAEGAVLNTASQAALRGLRVIVPVDAIASVNPYSEQYTVWHLGNSPRVGPQVTLTRLDLISF